MYIIDCLPFSKSLRVSFLSYFSSEFIEPGSLVKIDIRNRKVVALVFKTSSAREVKSELKSANFKIKKISNLVAKPFLSQEFLEAVKKTADYFASTEGAVLYHLVPAIIFKNPQYAYSINRDYKKLKKTSKKEEGIFATQSEEEERLSNYRLLIREEFAKNKSVFFCLPQNENVLELKKELERGIESFVCAFHKNMTVKEFREVWKKVNDSKHPIVIIGTSRWLFIEREDLNVIVLERENENGWKTIGRPFFDLRYFNEKLAEAKKIKIILGDTFLRTETLYRHKKNEILKFENLKWRLSTELPIQTIDLKVASKKEEGFKAVADEVIQLIKENIRNKNNTFVFASRKGFSSLIICRDCGTEVKCLNCGSPMILYKTSTGNLFRCHQCDEKRPATEYCQNCQSWKLGAFGSGMERVASEIKKEIPGVKVYEISKDKTSKNKTANLVKNFYEDKGSVMVGTEMAFPYLHKKITTTIIASFDSLFAIPDFRIKEKIFRIILQTKNLAKRQFIIQSRNLDDEDLQYALSGNLKDFYESEIEDRKMLDYPPFSIFIKITVRGRKNLVTKESQKVESLLKNFKPVIFNSIHEKNGEEMATNLVIKIPKEDWIDPELLALLKSLPPYFEIKVDPDNLL